MGAVQISIGQGDHGQLTGVLRSWLYLHAMLHRKSQRGAHARKHNERYASTEELVLFNAKPVNANFRDMDVEMFPDMPLGQCFNNACDAAREGWLYTEGWAVYDHGLPTHHAWLQHEETDQVADPTWRKNYLDHEKKYTNEVWTGNVVYWGVSIHRFDHAAWTLRYGYPNLLSLGDYDIPEVRRWGTEAWTMHQGTTACPFCNEPTPTHVQDCPKRIIDAMVERSPELHGARHYG